MGNLGSCFKGREAKTNRNTNHSSGDGTRVTRSNGSSTQCTKPLPSTPETVQIENIVVEGSYTDTKDSQKDLVGANQLTLIRKLYRHYADEDLGFIGAEGTERLCQDLRLDPEDYLVLVLAYSLNTQSMCKFQEDEFVAGCTTFSVTNIQELKQALSVMRSKIITNAEFPKFYRWAYKFALDVEKGQRTLSADIALGMWKLVFTDNLPTFLHQWLAFIQSASSIKGISRDTWDMFLIFADQIGDDLSRYNDADSWPSLLDDFVEELRENAG